MKFEIPLEHIDTILYCLALVVQEVEMDPSYMDKILAAEKNIFDQLPGA